MRNENASSKPNSATTSTTEPPTTSHSPDAVDNAITAAETDVQFLDRQADEAKVALKRTIADFKHAVSMSLVGCVDFKALTRDHPWASVGIAVASGFSTAAIAVPSREEQALRKLAAYQRILHKSDASAQHGDSEPAPRRSSMLRTILHETFLLAKPAITAALTAGISAKLNPNPVAPPEPGPSVPEPEVAI
jgi:ElaB/YqjD/DUF883 family membrane-anchored ribosome-binding protein